MKIEKFKKIFGKEKIGYLFILPQMILFLLFMIYPMFEGIHLSFFKVSLQDKVWVGLQNYTSLLSDEVFIRALGNTMIFVIFVVVLNVLISLFVSASIFDKNPKFVSFIRGTFYIPSIVGVVVMSMIWRWLFNPSSGIVNYFIRDVLGFKTINFLGNGSLVLYTLIFIMVFSSVGESIILVLAAMISIPPDLFEAAEIDGANRWGKFLHINLPLIKPTTLYIAIITTIGILKIFAVVQLTTAGGPAYRSTTLMYILYERAFRFNQMGSAAAIGTIMFVIAALISIASFRLLKSRV